MNNKGFTLIELLAAMTLLAILSALTVPTVLNTMESTRQSTTISDSKKLLSKVERLLQNNNNTIKKPRSSDECIIITLGYLDDTTDFQVGPHGYKYSINMSYVLVKRSSTFSSSDYNYYVSLVEEYDDGTSGYYGIQNAYDDGTGDSNDDNVLRNNIGKGMVGGIINPIDPTKTDSSDSSVSTQAIADAIDGTGCTVMSNLYDKTRLLG